MADGLGEVLRRAVDANIRYYEAWGKIAGDYLRELREVVNDLSPEVRLPKVVVPTAASRTTPSRATVEPAARAAGPAPRPSLVLQAGEQGTAAGAVLVENHLSHPVSAKVEAHLEGGAAVAITVDPDRVDLAPGESAIVRVQVSLPDDGGPLEDVRGQLLVPELVGTAVPLLIRRGRPPAPHPAD